MTAVRLVLFALLATAVAIVATVAGVFSSVAGTQWVIERGIAASGVPVEMSRIDGSLLLGVRIGAVRIRLEHSTIDIKGLEVAPAWRMSGARRALVLDRLAIMSVSVTVTGKPVQRRPFEWVIPAPPIAFDVRRLQVGRFSTDGLPERFAPELEARLSYDGSVFSVRDLDLRAPALSIEGNLTLTAAEDVPVDGELKWRVLDPALSGNAVLTRTLRELDVDARVDEPLRAAARGRVRLLGEVTPYFDFSILVSEWTNGQVNVSDLGVDVVGTLEHFDAEGSAKVQVGELPTAQVTARFGGSLPTIDIAQATLELNDGRAIVKGRVEREPQLAADLTVDLDRLDPRLFHDSLSGALSGRIEVMTRDEDIHVVIASVEGDLNQAPFRVSGRVGRVVGVWSAREVEIISGPNSAALTLDWDGERIDGGAELDMPELATLLPELNGDLRGKVTFAGTLGRPNLVGAFASGKLDYGQWSLRDLRVDATSGDARSVRTRIEIASAARGDLRVDRVDVDAHGTLDAIEGTLSWSLGEERGSIAAAARNDAGRWDIVIEEGALLTLPRESWRLDRRANATLEGAAYSVSAHCWQHTRDVGRLCVEAAEQRGANASLVGTLEQFDVAVLVRRFEGPEGLAGTLSGRWNLASDARGWRGTAAIETDRLALVDPGTADVPVLDLPRLAATATVSSGGVDLRLEAWDEESRVLNTELRVAGFDGAATLTGHANVTVEDLGFIATFSRRVGEIQGALTGDFDISGSVAEPNIGGALVVRGARIVLIEPGVELRSLDLTMQLSGLTQIDIRGMAHGANGSVTIEGSVLEPFTNQRRLHARVDATNLAVRVPDLEAQVTGGVDIDWQEGLVAVKGRVEVPRAAITISQLPAGAVPVSADIIVINRAERRASSTRLQVDLELDLKDAVRFTAFGLSTGLAGSLRLRQSADRIVQLNGSLALVDGTFKAFDQTLAIDSGRLTYSGSPTNPFVDARASRTIQESGRRVTVGARIQGPLDSIETTLFSDPSMSDAATLAYLVLGRPLDTATEEEGSNVMGAAIALGLKGAAPVIKEIRDAFGLEELTATGGGAEDLTVIAGKRFDKRLFVRYSYQTFTRVSALLIELLLTRRLSLEATASDIPAVDFVYRVGDDN